MRILVVEDDALLGDGMVAGLMDAGFTVDWVRDGQLASNALLTAGYTAVVLDLQLPRRDGMSVLTELRQRQDTTPVLVLTARDSITDRVTGLNAGADDYLIKPFDLTELIARLRALARRAHGHAQPILIRGPLQMNPHTRVVSLNDKAVDLSSREFAVLELLLSQQDRPISREQLEQQLYGWGEEIESNAIEVHIHHLRKKLGSDVITTLRGVGYVIRQLPQASSA
jgi:DNA-binding response OmpR family regulator